MKKILLPLLIGLLALSLTGFAPLDTYSLTVKNISGRPIAVRLIAEELVDSYYLPVAKGDREQPFVKRFDIIPDDYTLQVVYIEYWDPVYGLACGPQRPFKLEMDRAYKLTVYPCDEPARPSKEKMLRHPTFDKRLLQIPQFKRPPK
jgi:hypothetical protein